MNFPSVPLISVEVSKVIMMGTESGRCFRGRGNIRRLKNNKEGNMSFLPEVLSKDPCEVRTQSDIFTPSIFYLSFYAPSLKLFPLNFGMAFDFD
jgi:hypothetical protein